MRLFIVVASVFVSFLVSAQTQEDLDNLLAKANAPKNYSQEDIEIANQRCKINFENGTFLAANGTIWQACLYGQTWQSGQCVGAPKSVTWYEAMDAAKNSNFFGKSDWILPSAAFLNGSIHPQSCNHPKVKTYVREYMHGYKSLEVVDNFWTANTNVVNGGNTVAITDSSYAGGYASLHYDTMKSASHFDKSFTKPVYAVFVRNASTDDVAKFSNAQSLVQCNASCLTSRKAAQQGRDATSAKRGDEFNNKVSSFFNAGTSGSTSSSNSNASWAITSQADGGGLAHWYVKKYYLKCMGGRKSGESFTVHQLKSGGYQEVYNSVRKSFAEAAADGCP